MIDDLGYRILRALAAYGSNWGVETLSREVNAPRLATLKALHNLIQLEQVEFRYGYQITEEGIEELNRAPNLTTKAKEWANLVRQGINSSGHETRVERAAIPSRFSPLVSYTPDMEGLIDALRGELSEYDD